jgi:hypothetical protein
MGSGIITTTNSQKCPLHLLSNRWWHQAAWPTLNQQPSTDIQGIFRSHQQYGRTGWSIMS